MKLQSETTVLLLISLILIYPAPTNCISLRQFYESTNRTSQINSTFSIKFTHDEVISDHLIVLEKRKSQQSQNREPDFPIPLENHRVLTLYTLNMIKFLNPAFYQVKKEEFRNHILTKPVRDERIRAKALDLLEKYDISISCTWFHSLPPPFNTDECWVTEHEMIVKKLEELFQK